MTPETLAEIKRNDDIQKRLAKFMAHFCFRNSKLEDLHDRISDDEMKALMIDVVNRAYLFNWVMFNSKAADDIIDILKRGEHLPPDWRHWNDPDGYDLVKGASALLDLLKKRQSEMAE